MLFGGEGGWAELTPSTMAASAVASVDHEWWTPDAGRAAAPGSRKAILQRGVHRLAL